MESSKITKVVLPGLLPLLAGSGGLASALVFSAGCMLLFLILRYFYLLLARIMPGIPREVRWLLLCGFGFSLSSSIYILLPAVLPVTEAGLNFYFLFIGLSPIVYLGCTSKEEIYSFWGVPLTFAVFLILSGFLREFFGQGRILGEAVMDFALLPILEGPAGAFWIPGVLWLLAEIVLGGGVRTDG